MHDLRRFASRSALVPLASVVAMASAVLALLTSAAFDLGVWPVIARFPAGSLPSLFGGGNANVGGREVNWSGPLQFVLTLVVITLLAASAQRVRSRQLRACPGCRTRVPVLAVACRSCRMDLPE
jgi:hypothetical protein